MEEMLKSKKNEVSLRLNTKFYDDASISKSADDFSDVCKVDIKNMNDGTVNISLKPKTTDFESENLGREFCNYVLAVMRKNRF